MKKTLAIVLALAFALTLSVVALAEGLTGEETESVAETTEIAAEATEAEAAEEESAAVAADEAIDDEIAAEAADEVIDDEAAGTVEDEETETPDKESTPLDDKDYAELKNFIAWTKVTGAAWGLSEEECVAYGTVDFVLSHRVQSWYENYNFELPAEIVEAYGTADSEELPSILIYTSTGDKDSTETIKILYSGYDANGEYCSWEDTVTIAIPAGETVFYVIDDPDFEAVTGGFAILAGSYGDLYAALPSLS